jgi:hypothetical protein
LLAKERPEMSDRRRVARAAFTSLVLIATVSTGLVAPARSERVQKGNLIAVLNGEVRPRELPRTKPHPITVQIESSLATADGSLPPRLDAIELAVAGRGHLSTRGLARCPLARIRNATSRQAIERCGAARVGSGAIHAVIYPPHQRPFSVHGRLLAFNARGRAGGPAVWVHAYIADPPVSFVLPFRIRRSAGRFHTRLVARMPRELGPLARLTGFEIEFHRTFRYRARTRSYISASCSAPRVLPGGYIAIARIEYRFVKGRKISLDTVRGCRVR